MGGSPSSAADGAVAPGAAVGAGRPGRERRSLLAEVGALVDGGRWRDAIDLLQAAPATSREPRLAARLVRLRHAAAQGLDVADPAEPFPPPAPDPAPGPDGVPEVGAADLDVEALAGGIGHHGAVLVRGLLAPEDADRLRDGIDRAMEDRRSWAPGGVRPGGTSHFQPFSPGPDGPRLRGRGLDADGGALWAADAPLLLHDVLATFARRGVLALAEAYLGDALVLSVRKAVGRRVPPDLARADWHQDGAFLDRQGGLRAVNLWVALSGCGVDAPGLDLVPGRRPMAPTGTGGACFPWSVGDAVVDGLLEGAPPVRPRFGPGDALVFDHHLLHRTALAPAMDRERHALEWWCFGASSFPTHHLPLVV